MYVHTRMCVCMYMEREREIERKETRRESALIYICFLFDFVRVSVFHIRLEVVFSLSSDHY